MALRQVAAATVLALCATTLVVGPAAASPERDPVRRDGSHFPASIETTVPPGGYSTLTSPSIPKNATVLRVDLKVAEANATQAEVEAFDELATVLGKMTKGRRLLVCVMLFNSLVTLPQAEDDYNDELTFQSNEAILALVALVSCVRLAGLITSTPPAVARAALEGGGMRKCVQEKPGAPATVDKTDDGWKLTVDGAIQKTRSKVKVGCRTRSGKTVLRFRPAKKGVSLRKVMGKRPRFSLVSPADAQAAAPTKVTFRLP